MAKRPLAGSERAPLPGAHAIGRADSAERFEVTLVLRRSGSDALKSQVAKLASADKAASPLKRDDFIKRYSAAASDVAAVRKFAASYGLAVVEEHPARRSMVLSGTAGQFNEAFGVTLQHYDHDDGSYRGHAGSVLLPEELHGVVEAVLGLDNRAQARPHFRMRPPPGNVMWNAGTAAYAPTQLADLYDFPEGDGSGQCIALIELGGGYRNADLKSYFKELGLGAPKVSAVSVDHGRNHPTGDANGPDGEVMLDIEVAGAVAPGARIVVYFAPNTDAGFFDAITTAIHDSVNKPAVISISWGAAESGWTQQAMASFDQAFQDAAALGVTVCVASGDHGSSDGVSDRRDHVDFPASSPYVLACGGTSLRASNRSIQSETVWNDGFFGGATGGGVSNVFGLPVWQKNLKVHRRRGEPLALGHRGVPDVAADADPQTGYRVRVDGVDTVIGGTSAVAPLWAGLVARINASRKQPLGYVNPLLYKAAAATRDITEGGNGDFIAAKGWDACTGLGSPEGRKIAALT